LLAIVRLLIKLALSFMPFSIGPYQFANPLVLAPMAGVTDRPFRQLCRSLGAGMTVSEMITSRPDLRDSRKTQLRMDHQGEPGPIIVQIAGGIPQMMADAAQYNVDHGAQIIDINMGCPAKKVCKVDAGSALLKDTKLVRSILSAVVNSVSIPVTLKMRTGWSRENKNALEIAKIAEDCGIQALTIHGRTREDKYLGEAEYDTIRAVKQSIGIPVIANGDIDSAQKAKKVMDFTGADAIMMGRIAQRRPWIFKHIEHFLVAGELHKEPDEKQKQRWLRDHLNNLYAFYGEYLGVQIARKHINWQLSQNCHYCANVKADLMQTTTAETQLSLIDNYFEHWNEIELARIN
jgi:tRNA-dihydrouridine synthase B